MADRYWLGGNWSNTANWSATNNGAGGASVPAYTDNVYWHTVPTSQTYTIDGVSYCNDFDFTGATNSPKLEPVGHPILIYGSLTLITDMSIISPANLYTSPTTFIFKSTSIGKTITTAGHTLPNTSFNGNGGEWTLQDDLSSYYGILHQSGKLDLNNKNVKTTYFDSYWYNGVEAKELILGSSIITIVGTFYIRPNNLTFDVGTSTIKFIKDDAFFPYVLSGGRRELNGYGLTFYDIECNGVMLGIGGGDNNTINTLTIDAGSIVQFAYSKNYILTNFVANGTETQKIYLASTIPGINYTITKTSGVVILDHCIISDSIATGGATFGATNSLGLTNNVGWIITTLDTLPDNSIYRGNALQVYNIDTDSWFTWKGTVTGLTEFFDETVLLKDENNENFEQSETFYTRDQDLYNSGVVDIPWEFITKNYMSGINKGETLTDMNLHYKCSTNATVNVSYSLESTNLLSTSFTNLATTSDFIIDNKDHIKRIIVPNNTLQNVDYYNLRFNGTGRFSLFGMEQNYRVKKR